MLNHSGNDHITSHISLSLCLLRVLDNEVTYLWCVICNRSLCLLLKSQKNSDTAIAMTGCSRILITGSCLVLIATKFSER
jgi:hypothetical protein